MMKVVGLRHMGNPLCKSPSLCGLGGVSRVKSNMRNRMSVLCLVLWKSRGQPCLHGAELWLLSAAGPMRVVLFVLLQ